MVTQFYMFWIALVLGLVLCCVLACVRPIARSVPINYVLLFAFTLCESYMVGVCCAMVNDSVTVLAAICLTAGIVVGLTAYAATSKTDIGFLIGMIWVSSFALFFSLIFVIFFGWWFEIVYCCLGVILFGLYIIFDTKQIMGGGKY
mmetsp:Transcript_37593/g.27718  ORF Transcript_37593/g.27718 Transcript_37593/m.27718 type:complete len:146 (-) Transcript_37593:139-576(-)